MDSKKEIKEMSELELRPTNHITTLRILIYKDFHVFTRI